MDLIGGYLLVILALFSANLALLFGNYKMDNLKVAIFSLIGAVISFALMSLSSYLDGILAFLNTGLAYLFLITAVFVFLIMLNYVKRGNLRLAVFLTSAVFLVLVISLSSQSDLMFFDMIVYSLIVFFVLFLVYQLSKLLIHAKRQYPIIISEYMILSSILIFIFALTYYSTITLDYSMFTSFLILTPTYQLIYVVIAIVVLLVIGVLLNETKGGKL